jgi:PDZ domain/Aspartyl protease
VVRTTILRDVDLDIGGVPVNVAQMAGLPLTSISLSEGRAIDGVLGYSVVREFAIDVDYERRRLRFHDAATYAAPDGAVVVPITFDSGHPVAAAELTLADGRTLPMRMMVDTGARGGIVVNRPFAERHGIYDAIAPTIDAAYGMGIGGASHQRIGRAKRFAFAGVAFDAPIVSAATDRAGATAMAQVDGLIGGEILRRFTVTLDYARRRLLLAPNRALREPFELDMAGVAFKAADLKFDRILVRFVLPNSPAAEAGLHEDDEIVTVDGSSAAALTIAGIRDLFDKPDKRYVLRVRRGGRELDIPILTRRML